MIRTAHPISLLPMPRTTLDLRASAFASVVTVATIAAFAALSSGFANAATNATTAADASIANLPTPKTVALISMVGDEFTIVTQKEQIGSNVVDNFTRRVIRVPGNGINLSVLRGLDQAVAREFPDAERVLLSIPHDSEAASIPGIEREAAAYNKAINAISKMPQRMSWDRIVLVTPRWLFSARQGMASKLSGIGLYIQPLESATVQLDGANSFINDMGLKFDDEVETTKRGQSTRSETFMAPFFYAVVTTLDAKTLNVIKRDERYDFRKVVNPDSTAIRVQNSFEPEQLATIIDRFIETAAIRSVTDKKGTVEIGPLKSTLVPTPAEKK